MSFGVRVNGKAIITGEHAVIRGAPAIVFPVTSCHFDIRKLDNQGPFRVASEAAPEAKLVLMGVFERALRRVNRTFDDLRGTYQVESNIPLGAGLGASAALCVAVARYCHFRGWVSEGDLFDFSRELENIFHGESSGVDIAVALQGNPILYQRNKPIQTLSPVRKYWLSVSHCGAKGVTLDSVQSVKSLWSENPEHAAEIDAKMSQSAENVLKAFSSRGTSDDMIRGFQLARECFEEWGLAGGKLGDHMNRLLSEGALAVKPTGSGGGGHVLSLWKSEPTSTFRSQMFEVQRGES